MKLELSRVATCALLSLCAGLSAAAQLRVATHNISFFAGGRDADIATCYYGSFVSPVPGAGTQTFRPDVIMALEMESQAAVDSMVASLNTAYKAATGDTVNRWSAAPFNDGPDSDNVVYYRNDKVSFVQKVKVANGGDVNGVPRDVWRYDMKVLGYTSDAASFSCYPVHMKSGSASADQNRRQIEAVAIRNDMNALVAANPLRAFIFAGDMNVQSSTQTAYQTLVGGATNSRVNDPIKTPGTWNNNGEFIFVHTQDPSGPGGMDDRHDQILISSNLINGSGFEYVGNASIPYSTTSWFDPNHSYRCWGNDGTSFNAALTTTGNTMVGATIAQSIKNLATASGGHCPVFLDLKVPAAAAASTASIDFGDLYVNDPAAAAFTVTNTGDVAKFGVAGVANLNYSVALSGAGFSTATGPFVDAPDALPADGNTHNVTLDTTVYGPYTGTVTITTDAPDQPTLTVTLTGNVYCPADVNKDFNVDLADFFQFLNDFDQQLIGADVNRDTLVDLADFFEFLNDFDTNC